MKIEVKEIPPFLDLYEPSCPSCKSIKRLNVPNSLLCSPCYHEAMQEAFLTERNNGKQKSLVPGEGQKAWEKFCEDHKSGKRKL